MHPDASLAFNSFNKAFYIVTEGFGYYKKDINGGQADFWKEAEMIELAIDAYINTKNPVYKAMIDELIKGFCGKWKIDWLWNDFNDDVMWMVIASARAYQATGNELYKYLAKYHFDNIYARAWDSVLGGGLWWKTDKQQKNSCINSPAAIAAYLLYQIFQDKAYLSNNTFAKNKVK